jgi:DNA-binding SARP family transcriptional activator
VDIVGTESAGPASKSHQRVCTRIATFLALNRTATKQAMVHAVWGGRATKDSTVDPRLSNLRKWLGQDPTTATEYLPAWSLQLSEHVVTDWAVFEQTVGARPSKASTESLVSALSLVRGRLSEGEKSKNYGFAEHVLSEAAETVTDTAYELARRSYFDGQWRKAGSAAALGVLIEPGNERLWRIRIHAAHAAGDRFAVTEAVERMKVSIQELGERVGLKLDLEDETVELLRAISDRDAVSIARYEQAL